MSESTTQITAPVALVTGGARRLGRAIALALAADGWDVAVHYGRSRDEALATVAEIEALGRRALAVGCELDREAAVRGLLADCARGLGEVGCVVNNASLFEPDGAPDFHWATFERQLRVNAGAPVILAQQLHQRLGEGGRGVVVNLLDQKLWNPNPDFFSYTLTKAALETATRLLARALAPRLRVVGVAPGITLASAGQSAEGFARAHRATPLGHASSPQDVAQAVAFLARAGAITGTTLLVDGGQHLVPTDRDIMFVTEPAAAGPGARAKQP